MIVEIPGFFSPSEIPGFSKNPGIWSFWAGVIRQIGGVES